MKPDWRKQKRNRSGSIKTISGAIYARIQFTDEITGKRREMLRRAVSRRQARELLVVMRKQLEFGGQSTIDHDKLTFSELAANYEKTRLVAATYQNGIKISGKRSIGPTKSALKVLKTHLGRKRVRSILPSDVEEYKQKRLNTPVEIEVKVKVLDEAKGKNTIKREIRSRPRKIGTVNRELELLRAMLNFAKGEGIILKSPFDFHTKLISSAAEVHRDRILSRDEESRLLDACTGPRLHLRALVIVAVDTAMRRGEMFKLRWADVDLNTGTVRVLASNAKTERPRTIGLTSRSRIELERLWDNSPGNPDGLVFGVTNTIKNAWRTAMTEAAINDLVFHDLRHTGTTRMIRAGVPASEVMKITGHTQMRTFLRYLNLTDESVLNSAEMLDKYLGSGIASPHDLPMISAQLQ